MDVEGARGRGENQPIPFTSNLPKISETSCEKAVLLWEIHENSLPLPIIPPEEIVNPYGEPERDSSLSVLDLVEKVESGIFIRGQEIGRPAEWQVSLKKYEVGENEKEFKIGLSCGKVYVHSNEPIWAKVAYEILDKDDVTLRRSGGVCASSIRLFYPTLYKIDAELCVFYAGSVYELRLGTKRELQSKRNELIKDGILRIKLRLNIYKELSSPACAALTADNSKPPAKRRRMEFTNSTEGLASLLGSLDNLWKTCDRTGDVIIKCGGQILKAHKFILSGQSDVFMSMLDSQNDMREQETKTIEVDDITPEVMKAMLEFLYLGYSNELDWSNIDHLCAMIYAADKYWVVSLMIKCFQNLMKMMNLENFAKIAKVTFMYNCEKEFKNEVRHFFDCHQVTLNNVDSFRKFAMDDFEEFYKLFFYQIK